MKALNNLVPTMTSRVTDNVPEIISFINAIIDKGHAYKSSDGKRFANLFCTVTNHIKLLYRLRKP